MRLSAEPRPPVVLVGPQHDAPDARPDVGSALAELGVRGKVALVMAGHQERETDDGAVVAALGVPAVNLRLHGRGIELFREDTEFTTAYQARQQRLRHMQTFYRVRLDKIEDAARTISVRHVDAELLAQEEKVSVDQFRHLDHDHVDRCAAVHAAFEARWQPGKRPAVARHRAELAAALADVQALVIAGGHVALLQNRLALFDVLGLAAHLPIVAWSAGAMVLTDRVVLFHDYPPYGSDIAQVLDAGFGLVPGLVVLPDPQRKLDLGARAGIQRFARRMAPATCVAMDRGHRIVIEDGVLARASGLRLTTTGEIDAQWVGKASRFSSPVMRGRPA
jgi:hypothetical protein